jgi:hypothetical protein
MHVAADFLLGDDAGRGNPVARIVRIVHVVGILILDGILDGDDVFGMVAAAQSMSEARVVDLPEPVGPVTRQSPARLSTQWRRVSVVSGSMPSDSSSGMNH